MRVSGKARSDVSLGVAAVVLALHAPAVAQPADRGDARPRHGSSKTRIHLPDIAMEWRLRQAIDGAREWLGSPSCQALFSDFEDVSGKRLSDVLAERGLTGQDQLDRLGFYDGSDLRQCRVPGTV